MIGVIDASVALSWILADEHSAVSDALFIQVAKQGAVVPGLWRLEIANALQVSIKRQRITPAYRDATIQKLILLPIEVDPETDAHAWTTTVLLADIHHVTAYDACYLELALRRNLPLATRDDALAAAAGKAGVSLLPTH